MASLAAREWMASAFPITAADVSQTSRSAATSRGIDGVQRKEDGHAGPKKGRGAYYGHKWEAKRASSRRRREVAKRLSRVARRPHDAVDTTA